MDLFVLLTFRLEKFIFPIETVSPIPDIWSTLHSLSGWWRCFIWQLYNSDCHVEWQYKFDIINNINLIYLEYWDS